MNILAIGCHPDDVEGGCGGTLAKFAKQGHQVFMGSIANGSVGHRVIPSDELKQIRLEEARAGAKIIGAQHFCIGADDLTVEASNMDLLKEVVEIVRWAKPDLVITHNPQDYMRDHEQTSELVTSAAFCATVHHLTTKSPEFDRFVPVYYMETAAGVDFCPTDYVDISDVIDVKLAAAACHKSQLTWLKDHDDMDFLETLRMISRFRGNQCGVQYAEGFRHYNGWQRFATKRLLP